MLKITVLALALSIIVLSAECKPYVSEVGKQYLRQRQREKEEHDLSRGGSGISGRQSEGQSWGGNRRDFDQSGSTDSNMRTPLQNRDTDSSRTRTSTFSDSFSTGRTRQRNDRDDPNRDEPPHWD